MSELIKKLIKGEKILSADIGNELYEICCRVYSGCDNSCPVFEASGGEIVKRGECSCFKDGAKMLRFLDDKMKRGNFNKKERFGDKAIFG